MLNDLATQFALPLFIEFTERAITLERSSAALCNAPNEDTLSTARGAWMNTRTPWKQAELISFGPLTEYPLRLAPKLEDWPVNARAVEELIEADTNLALANYSQLGSAVRGFPVVEYLLWGAGDNPLALLRNTRRCEALISASADIRQNAMSLVSAWTEEWTVRLTTPTPNAPSPYQSSEELIELWVENMVFTLEVIRIVKIGKPAGDDSGGLPLPDTLQSRLSGRSLQDAKDALRGVRRVWFGDPEAGSRGIRYLLQSAELLLKVDEEFQRAEETLELIPETLETAIGTHPELVDNAQASLLALQRTLQLELAPALNATVLFGGAEGD